jgi:hypothetical protein
MTTTPAPLWHGWGLGGAQLSIAPSPDNARAIALILSLDGMHEVVAEFFSEAHAADTMAFLDGAFQTAAEANAVMVRRVEALGG